MVFYIKNSSKQFEVYDKDEKLYFIIKKGGSNFFTLTYHIFFDDKELVLRKRGIFLGKYDVLKNETSNSISFLNNKKKLIFNDSIIEDQNIHFFGWDFNVSINNDLVASVKMILNFKSKYLYKVEFYKKFDYHKIILLHICFSYERPASS